MDKEQIKKPNSKVLGALEYKGDVKISTTVELTQYNDKEHSQKTLSIHDNFKSHIKEGLVSWFQVTGISDVDYISKICKSFGLHNFDIRELLADTNIVKFVLYDNITFALISGYFLNDKGEINDMQIDRLRIINRAYSLLFVF